MAQETDRRFNLHVGPVICVEQGKGEFFQFQGVTYSDLKYSDVVMLEEALVGLASQLTAAAKQKAT